MSRFEVPATAGLNSYTYIDKYAYIYTNIHVFSYVNTRIFILIRIHIHIGKDLTSIYIAMSRFEESATAGKWSF